MECREPSVLACGKAPRTLSKQSLTDQWLWLSFQVRRRLGSVACPIPYFGLASMNSDLGPVPQLGFQTPERISSALRLGDDESVIEVREQMVSV